MNRQSPSICSTRQQQTPLPASSGSHPLLLGEPSSLQHCCLCWASWRDEPLLHLFVISPQSTEGINYTGNSGQYWVQPPYWILSGGNKHIFPILPRRSAAAVVGTCSTHSYHWYLLSAARPLLTNKSGLNPKHQIMKIICGLPWIRVWEILKEPPICCWTWSCAKTYFTFRRRNFCVISFPLGHSDCCFLPALKCQDSKKL